MLDKIWPTTPHALYIWTFFFTAGYIILALVLDTFYQWALGQPKENSLTAQDWLFNGATFAGSATIAMGIWDEKVLKLIGDTSGYLGLACLVGFVYSFRALRYKSDPADRVKVERDDRRVQNPPANDSPADPLHNRRATDRRPGQPDMQRPAASD